MTEKPPPQDIHIQQTGSGSPASQFIGVVYGDVHIHNERSEKGPEDDAPGPLRNPYKGLRAFTHHDVADFFGRKGLVDKLLDKFVPPEQQQAMRGDRLLAVVGASGSGKSSVVRAGLVPQLLAGAVPQVSWWTVVVMTPGEQPFEMLATQLGLAESLKAIAPMDLIRNLRSDERGLHQLAERALAGQDPYARFLLVVDQFEELYTQTRPEERGQFIQSLVTAVTDSNGRLMTVLTVRADFYGQLTELGALQAWLPDSRQVNVTSMSLGELRQVIVGPAEQVGLQFEDGLVDRILDDVEDEPGALPLLEYALTQLYDYRQGPTRTLEDYEAIGGVQGALARTADQAYRDLTPPQQTALRGALLRLVMLGEGQEDTRRRVRLPDLRPAQTGEGPLTEVLDVFVSKRLLTAGKDDQGDVSVPFYEISHEALIGHWARFRSWLEESRTKLRLHRQFEQAARLWEDQGQHLEYLAPRLLLERVQTELGPEELNDLERAYLDASLAELAAKAEREVQRAEQELRQRRLVRLVVSTAAVAGIGMLLLLLVVSTRRNIELETEATAYAWYQGRIVSWGHGGAALPTMQSTYSPEIVPTMQAQLATQTSIDRKNPIIDEAYQAEHSVEMVLVPAGCFIMGSIQYGNEQPVHEACFEDDFWIDLYEVTNRRYRQFVDDGGYAEERYWTEAGWAWKESNEVVGPHDYDPPYKAFSGEDQPRMWISWYEAAAYCAWREARLPTEAEWEYAARGPDSLVYPWGNEWIADNAVWGRGHPAEVGSRPDGVSWVGAYDLSGNALEWVSTIYDQERYPYPYATADGREDAGSAVPHVLRGGAYYYSNSGLLRAGSRGGVSPNYRDLDGGFRCARLE